MAAILARILMVVAFAANVHSECPQLDDIPVTYSPGVFTCARFYYGYGHDLAVRGCNGCSVDDYADLPHGLDTDAGEGRIYPMGSAIVRPGCSLYVFHKNNYAGSYDRYDGPAIIANVRSGQGSATEGCADGNPSIQCRCTMDPVSCTPDDSYAVVLRCDATGAIEPTNCKYVKTVGSIYSEEVSESMSIDVTIKEEIKESFFDIFSSTIGVSVSTGYDWSHTTSVTKSELEQFEVNAIAPPGYVLNIEQVIGHCGGSEAKTELFRISHTDAKGNIVKTFYEKTLPGGKTVHFDNLHDHPYY